MANGLSGRGGRIKSWVFVSGEVMSMRGSGKIISELENVMLIQNLSAIIPNKILFSSEAILTRS